MKRAIESCWALLLLAAAADAATVAGANGPLVHTYSIVARDSATGDFGVAVQSHWFSVGPVVPWAEAGVGAVATQSLVEIAYGPRALDLLKQGYDAQRALDTLLARDPERDVRQVAIVDAQGRVAAHTGARCIPDAGHATGSGFSVQANLMRNDRVWGAMRDAYRGARGDLAERLLQALEAAESAGGDIRGKQSAAILIVRAHPTDRPWTDRTMDLRVEDSPAPLPELRRLVSLHRAYDAANRGDEQLAKQNFDGAMSAYAEAARLAPESEELRFWKAAALFKEGKESEALADFRWLFARNGDWAVLVPRLSELNVIAELPAAFAAAVERILAVAPPAAQAEARKEWEKRRPR
jgi:uncharacterized Ntn-hydrolase superfamily protein